MTDTVVSSATKEVVIGSGRPFVIIGERINPTGRKKLAEEMKAGDFSTVIADTVNQVEAGAHMLDVNAGIPLADEPAILAETVKLVQSLTDVPLSIDSSIVAALEAGLEVYEGKPLVNSVTGEDERIEQVLPLVAKYGAAVVAITNDETGISEDPDVRFAVAEKIVHAAADHGIAAADVVVDPLVMPIGALGGAGRQVFSLVRRLHDELGVNSTCGASNVSFGLPDRNRLNGAFLAMAIANGLTSAITSPLHDEVREAVMAADVMMGNDQDCNAWIAKHREQPAGRHRSSRGQGRPSWCWGRRWADAERRSRSGGDARTVSEAEGSLVVFTPSGKRGRFDEGTNLLDAARTLGVDLDSVCGGRGICGRCQVVVSEGEFAKHGITSKADHLTAFSEPESRYRERSGLAADRRLGCHARVCGDLVVDVPPESQIHRQVVRKEADAHPIEVDPVVRLHYVEVREPDLADPSGDLQRLLEALDRDWSLEGLACDPHVLATLQRTLRAGDWTATVAVHDGSTITAIWPGFHDVALGGGVRHRLHHRGRPPLRSAHRRGARERRRDEPADPVRRGPDEPRQLRDDESRRRDRADPRDPRVRRRAGRRALHGGRGGPERRARPHDRRQPDHASPVPRPRPHGAGRRAVRAGHRRGGDDERRGSSISRPRTPAPASTSCRASRATSVPTPPA